MKKVVIWVIVVVVLLLAGAGYLGWRGISEGNVAPADFSTKPWVEHGLGMAWLAFDVPKELKPADEEIPAEKEKQKRVMGVVEHVGRWHGMEVGVVVSAPPHGSDADAALEQMARRLKSRPGITTVSETRKEEVVLGARAVSLQLDAKNWSGVVFRSRILVFVYNECLHQVHYTTLAKDPQGAEVWERMVKSIRRIPPNVVPGATLSPPASGVPDPKTGLPPGFKRR